MGTQLVGIYVHGSLAFGCFNPRVSDVDFVVVVRGGLSLREKKAMIRILLEVPDSPAKGFEMSVVQLAACQRFLYPTPFELHFSQLHLERCREDLEEFCEEMHGTDRDLAAHFTVIRHRGIVLYGAPIEAVFGPVPREAFWDSLMADSADALESVQKTPVYTVLNLCRLWAYKAIEAVLSKSEGALWVLEQMDSPVVQAALDAYENRGEMQVDTALLKRFCTMVLKEIGGDVC
ncbi:DUF4111 domain-containing protein [Fusibacter sp. JL298sf-3]